MKSQVLFAFIFSFVYFACTPPDSVRTQDFTEQAADGYFAHIPVGLSALSLALGETIQETEGQCEERLEFTETENDHYKLSQLKFHHSDLNADTLITCGFRDGRLSAVLAKTTFKNTIEQNEVFMQKLAMVYAFIPQIQNNFNLSKSLEYAQTDQIFSRHFSINKNSDGFSGFEYMISYTCETPTFQSIFNS